MAKKLEQKPFGVESTFNGKTLRGGLNVIEPTHSAFSIVYTGKKKYSVVEIKFVPETTYTTPPIVIASNLDIYEAHHEFKKATIDAGLFEVGLDKV